MSIIKNEVPILEYDSDKSAVLLPTHENLNLKLPKKAVFAFLGEHIDNCATKNKAARVGTFVSATKNYPIYVVEHKNEKICLCQAPVGAAASTQILDWLIGYGVEEIISTGCCGTLIDIPENVFIVPYKALRDEGTSYHYLPPSRYVHINPLARKAIEKAMSDNNLQYQEVITWSTDGFYRETKEKVCYRKEEGCAVVEMECSALAACAELRNVIWGCILFTADTLADIDNYNERDWGQDSFEYALELSLDAVTNIKGE